jgi:hypothetical protein
MMLLLQRRNRVMPYTPEQTREALARARAAVFATAASAAAHAPDHAGAGLVYKRRDDALVAAANPKVARTEDPVSADDNAVSEPWWRWVEKHCDYRMDVMSEAVAEALGWTRAEMREHTEREVGTLKREIELMRRELAAMREQVALERGLRALRDEVAEARAEMPKLPAITARLEADQVRLRGELDATKRKLQANQLVMGASLSKLRKQAAAARVAASVEMELETSSAHFVMRDIHPAAAQALHEFASQVVGPWNPAGTA